MRFQDVTLASGLAYTGIGARETPDDILSLMEEIGRALSGHGLTLRSGGANGADSAFERGTSCNLRQIFLPWKGFNARSPANHDYVMTNMACADAARAIARSHHPIFDKLRSGVQLLHTRNVPQVLGPDLASPSAFVLCWTADGQASGGTGQALRVAMDRKIPVFNLQQASTLADVLTTLKID